jgi:hypothetical protein
MEQLFKDLTTKLKEAFGDGLLSVVIYGSAASGDHHGKYSDVNVLCVVSRLGPAELMRAAPALAWWRSQHNPPPMLMTLDELKSSTDAFPIEFHDLLDRRKTIYGVDAVAGLQVSKVNYRAQIERELRSSLFRLRLKAAPLLAARKGLLELMLDSVSTFCLLGRHAMLAAGLDVGPRKRDAADVMRGFGVDSHAFHTLLDIREGKIKPESVDPQVLFGSYLTAILTLIRFVDELRVSS